MTMTKRDGSGYYCIMTMMMRMRKRERKMHKYIMSRLRPRLDVLGYPSRLVITLAVSLMNAIEGTTEIRNHKQHNHIWLDRRGFLLAFGGLVSIKTASAARRTRCQGM